MVAAAHDPTTFIDADLKIGGGAGTNSDAKGILLIAIYLFIGAERQNDPVVQGGAERGAFFFPYADDLAGCVVPANLFANGIEPGHKVFDDIVADDADGSGIAKVGLGNVTPGDEIDVVKLGHLRRPSAVIGVLERV